MVKMDRYVLKHITHSWIDMVFFSFFFPPVNKSLSVGSGEPSLVGRSDSKSIYSLRQIRSATFLGTGGKFLLTIIASGTLSGVPDWVNNCANRVLGGSMSELGLVSAATDPPTGGAVLLIGNSGIELGIKLAGGS